MNSRLETFCDGVFAIAITLLILEIKVPPLASVHSTSDVWQGVQKLWPSFFALTLSFIIIFVSWIGHHNLLRTIDKTSPQFLVANGFFMFTVIIMPFPTAFMAEYLDTPYAQPSIVIYSIASLFHNVGWNVLYSSILKPKPLMKHSVTVDDMKKASKGAKYGFVIYAALVLLALWFPYVVIVITLLTWIYWLFLSLSIKPEH